MAPLTLDQLVDTSMWQLEARNGSQVTTSDIASGRTTDFIGVPPSETTGTIRTALEMILQAATEQNRRAKDIRRLLRECRGKRHQTDFAEDRWVAGLVENEVMRALAILQFGEEDESEAPYGEKAYEYRKAVEKGERPEPDLSEGVLEGPFSVALMARKRKACWVMTTRDFEEHPPIRFKSLSCEHSRPRRGHFSKGWFTRIASIENDARLRVLKAEGKKEEVGRSRERTTASDKTVGFGQKGIQE